MRKYIGIFVVLTVVTLSFLSFIFWKNLPQNTLGASAPIPHTAAVGTVFAGE
jgi:hypothetical protein